MSRDRDTEILESWLEEITGGINSINSDHTLIHQGYGFCFSIYETLTNAQVKTYSFKAPTSRFAHIKNLVLQSLGGSVKLEILRDVTVTGDTGTAVLTSNLNDNSTSTPTATVKATPTYSGGTVALALYSLSDATNQTTGNGSFALNTNEEFITKSSDKYYVLKFTNLTTESVPIAFKGFFYEELKGLT